MHQPEHISNRKATDVSIIMCTYNGEQHVQEQLQTIVRQTYPVQEILIFDDCSTDDTVEIIKTFAAKDNRIVLTVNTTNLGFARNFEQAILSAKGDVIAIADQDDIWMPEKIERMMAVWKETHPLIYCYSYLFSGQPPANPRPDPNFRRFEGTDPRKIFLYNIVSGHALLIRRSFLPYIFPLEPGVMYDWYMAVAAAYNGGVQYLPEILVLQRMHDKNITVENTLTPAQRREKMKRFIIPHARAFRNIRNIPEKDKAMLTRFADLLETSLTKERHWPLFRFLVTYRNLLFFYKRRAFPIISQIKHSLLFSKNG